MVGRILRTADFERALAQAPRSRSTHFAAHHVAACPSAPAKGGRKPSCTELSTDDAPTCPPPVDELPSHWWLGTVVPKRHARRSVTRNLIKRQMREVMGDVVRQISERPSEGLPHGLWVLRLKSPFDPKQFTSPASVPLRQAARDEIALLLSRALLPQLVGPAEGRRRTRRPEAAVPVSPLQSAPPA